MKLLSENYIFYMRFRKGITYFFLIVLSIVTMLPLLFLLINAFKSQAEIIRNPLALPTSFDLRYLKTAFQAIHFGRASIYTLTLVAVSLVGIIFFSSLCAWMIARRKSRGMKVLYFLFVAAMLIPFQVIMYPLISILEKVSMKNLVGLIILYTGFGISMSVFMMTGYIKSVPKDIEESAVIDGANILQVFFYIMIPLIKPMIITIIILNGMWIWNDYLLPFLVLGTSDLKTLTLEIYYVKMTAGQYGSPWETLFPSVLIAILPLIVIFLLFQKHFVKGVTAGAVKS